MVSVTTHYDHKTRRGTSVARFEVTFSTSDLTTTGSDAPVLEWEGYDQVTLYFQYTGDDSATVQVFDAPDVGFSRGNQHQVGSDVTLPDGSATTQFATLTVTRHAPFVRVNASTDAADATSGELVVDVCAKTT
jgi:hypothetical protein